MGSGKGKTRRARVVNTLDEQLKMIAAVDMFKFPHLHSVLVEAWRSHEDATITGDVAADLNKLLGTPEGVGIFNDVYVLFNQLRIGPLSNRDSPRINIQDCVLEGTKRNTEILGLYLGTMRLENVTFKDCDLRRAVFPSAAEDVHGVTFDNCLLKGMVCTEYITENYENMDWIRVKHPTEPRYMSLEEYLCNIAGYEDLMQSKKLKEKLVESVGEKISF